MTRRSRPKPRFSFARRVVIAVIVFYLGVGVCVEIAAVASGTFLGALVGFLIVSVALAAAAGFSEMNRLGRSLAATDAALRRLRGSLNQLSRATQQRENAPLGIPRTAIVDLSAVGTGDPSVLAAATLDRSRFPRLSDAMAETPPAQVMTDDPDADSVDARSSWASESAALADASDLATRNLLRQWKLGLRTGDLPACRDVFAALVDMTDEATVARIRQQLRELTDRTEVSLRADFSERVRRRDFLATLAVGERICRLLPDRPVAEEFRRIRPYLLRRCASAETGSAPQFRVVRE